MVSRSRPPMFRRKKTVPKANKKLATVGAVKRMINNRIDKTIVCSSTAGSTTTTAGTVYPISSLTVDSRMSKLTVRTTLSNASANTFVRLILFQWNETSTPTATDVLTTAAYNNVHDNVTDYSKFVNVLSDRIYPMTLYDNSVKAVVFSVSDKKLKRIGINNVGYTNNVWLLEISSSTNTTIGTMYYSYEYINL